MEYTSRSPGRISGHSLVTLARDSAARQVINTRLYHKDEREENSRISKDHTTLVELILDTAGAQSLTVLLIHIPGHGLPGVQNDFMIIPIKGNLRIADALSLTAFRPFNVLIDLVLIFGCEDNAVSPNTTFITC